MILVDSSIWIDHLKRSDAQMEALLMAGQVLMHPFVHGELALSTMKNRAMILEDLKNLPACLVATDDEVLAFIDQHNLNGVGIGLIDVHLLASVKLTQDAKLWSRDRNLTLAADRLDIVANIAH